MNAAFKGLRRAAMILLLVGVPLTTTSGKPMVKGESSFRELYDYYYPERANNILSMYRAWFDCNLLAAKPRDRLGKQEKTLRLAVRGDRKAFRAFVRSDYRDAEGEFAENWHYGCVFLLLVLGDEVFASLIVKEDSRTIQSVRETLDVRINWRKHPFPLTRRALTANQPSQRER